MAKVITLCGTYHFPTNEDRENFAKNIGLSSQFDFITFRYEPGELPYVIEYFDINHGEAYGELSWGNAVQNFDKSLSLPSDINYDSIDDMRLGTWI